MAIDAPGADPAGVGDVALLEALAVHARDPGAGSQARVHVALLDATVLVPTPDPPEAPGTVDVVSREVLVVVTLDEGDHIALPAFTSAGAVLAWQPEGAACVAQPAVDLFRVAVADTTGTVVVNPGSPSPFVLDPLEIAALAEGVVPGSPSSGPVLVATPREGLPQEAAEAVRDAMASEPSVRRAALFLVDQGGQGAQPTVVVWFASGAESEADVAEAMGRIVHQIAARTEAAAGLTLVVATPDWGTTFDDGGTELFRR